MARLNDTAAITGQLREGHTSRDVRKVGGGHIVRDSASSPLGEYVSTERFVPKGTNGAGAGKLAEAMRIAKGGR